MYEMQGPRQDRPVHSPIAPASWAAGAIGDPRASLSATGPGHPAGSPVARSPSACPGAASEAPRGCPQGSPESGSEARGVAPKALRVRLPAPRLPSTPSAPAPLSTEVALDTLGALPRLPGSRSGPPGVSSGALEVPSEWYPFSLVEKLYSHSGAAHKRVRRLFS